MLEGFRTWLKQALCSHNSKTTTSNYFDPEENSGVIMKSRTVCDDCGKVVPTDSPMYMVHMAHTNRRLNRLEGRGDDTRLS